MLKPAKALRRILQAVIVAVILIAAMNFPYDVDAPLSAQELDKSRQYYAQAYKQGPTPGEEQAPSEYDTKYLKIATAMAASEGVNQKVEQFVASYGLHDKPVLEIGSGRGYLQDFAEDYTGLDISSTVSHFYHKKFVLGTATALPFADNTFDGGWSIWVFEHVPNPEQALLECRRVMKNNAVFLFFPAWSSPDWLAQGYDVRPYSDFDWRGKLIKASVPVRSSAPYKAAARIPNRIVRDLWSRLGPTTLHYRRLEPNYKEYWEPDSDAANSIDRYEAMLWFRSRGDECLNCTGSSGSVFMKSEPMIIRFHK